VNRYLLAYALHLRSKAWMLDCQYASKYAKDSECFATLAYHAIETNQANALRYLLVAKRAYQCAWEDYASEQK
jgi:hypothetical protein